LGVLGGGWWWWWGVGGGCWGGGGGFGVGKLKGGEYYEGLRKGEDYRQSGGEDRVLHRPVTGYSSVHIGCGGI